MRTNNVVAVLSLALLLSLGALPAAAVDAADVALPQARPESVGFSSARLKRLEEGMQGQVEAKQLAGAITAVARHGKLVHYKTYGQQDIAAGKAMQADAIVRIYSMTKPIVGVAMMMLYEEGKWRPTDPLSKYIPEFANLKVAGVDADGKPTLDAPAHAPTVGELMSHTAGFTYGLFGNTATDKAYREANLFAAGSLKEFIDKLATLPLAYQPGEGWVYSVSVDVQGYLVEKLSGQTLSAFLAERIFKPLQMKDTGFYVPADKLSRVATIYSADAKGLTATPNDPRIGVEPGMASGGGGLYSTMNDYLRFAQMLLNKGELNGERLLAPSTVALMTSDHLPDQVQNGKFGIGMYRMQPGLGFGYDVAVMDDPLQLGSPAGKGSYLWDGVAGTWFWVDPTNDLIFVGIIQRRGQVPGSPNIEDLARALTYQALVDPSK